MARARLILRVFFLALILGLLIYMTVRNDKDMLKIAEFKYGQLERLKSDSLNAEQKVKQLVNETTKFSGEIIEGSSHMKGGLIYLEIVVALLVVSEIFFAIRMKQMEK